MTAPKAKLFALSTCSHCKAVKKLLDQYNVDVDMIHVDQLEGDARKAVLAEVKHYNRRVSFPTTVIGDEVIVGNKREKIKQAIEQF
jgi:glutaredoxin